MENNPRNFYVTPQMTSKDGWKHSVLDSWEMPDVPLQHSFAARGVLMKIIILGITEMYNQAVSKDISS